MERSSSNNIQVLPSNNIMLPPCPLPGSRGRRGRWNRLLARDQARYHDRCISISIPGSRSSLLSPPSSLEIPGRWRSNSNSGSNGRWSAPDLLRRRCQGGSPPGLRTCQGNQEKSLQPPHPLRLRRPRTPRNGCQRGSLPLRILRRRRQREEGVAADAALDFNWEGGGERWRMELDL